MRLTRRFTPERETYNASAKVRDNDDVSRRLQEQKREGRKEEKSKRGGSYGATAVYLRPKRNSRIYFTYALLPALLRGSRCEVLALFFLTLSPERDLVFLLFFIILSRVFARNRTSEGLFIFNQARDDRSKQLC